MKKILFILSLIISLGSVAQPSWQWANAINSTQDEKTLDVVTVLTSGETYTCGYFDGDLSAIFTLGLNGTPNMNAPIGVRDGFVAKYDAVGNLFWAFKIGGVGATVEIEAITDAPNGNIYVTGEFFDGPVDFQGVVSSISSVRTPTGASKNMFLAAYNSNGELLWVTSSTDTGNSIGFGITADANGIYVVGRFGGDITFPPLAPITWSGVASYFDAFVTKFDFSGNATNVKTIFSTTGDGHVKAFNVTTDGTDVYAIGTSESTSWTYGPTGLNPTDGNNGLAGTDDIWVISFRENNFNLNWSQVIGGVEDDVAKGLTNDATGLYLTGGLGGASIRFPGIPNVPSIGTAKDIFTSKLFSVNGLTDWVFLEQNNSLTDAYGSDVVVDAAGDLYITGSHTGTTDFNGALNSIPAVGGLDVFVMSRTNTGIFNWAISAGGLGNDEGFGIGIDNSGGIYTGGSYDLISSFGALSLATDVQNNGFVAKLNTCSLSIVCPANQTATANASCQYTLLDYTAMATPFASCGIASVKQIPIAGTVVNSGINPITVYLTDNSGNVDSCSFDVVVEANVNPIVVNCGDWLQNETTFGQTNTANNFSCVGFPTPGEDSYYQITVPSGNYWLQFNLDSVADANDTWVETFWVGGSCPLGGGCLSSSWYDIATQQFATGGNSVQYLATGPGTYYFVVDAQVDGIDSYNIGFNCLDGGIEFDTSLTCGDPNNDGIIPYVNGSTTLTAQTCQSVNICHDIFVANQQDFEWIDSVHMVLGPCYTNVIPTTVAGFYQPGNWIGIYDGPSSSISWQFNNTSVASFGDGSGGNYSCDLGLTRMHTLCFTADISSNCAADSNLNVSLLISDDAIGSGGGSVASFDYVLSDDFVITNPNPSIVCPSNVSVSAAAGLCAAQVNGISPVLNDNCPNPFATYILTGATTGSGLNDASGNSFNVGVTIVKYIVSDSLGLLDSCTFTVTVNDTENPTITCPGNFSTNAAGCSQVVIGIAPTASGDNCVVDSIDYVLSGATTGSGLNDASGIAFNTGITTVTYTITDTSGNTSSCSFTVTINDLINPTISCPANVNVSCPGVVNTLAPTATGDNCGIDSVSYVLTGATTGSGLVDASGSSFNVGVTTITYTVTDLSGNTTSCNFTVTVNDLVNPTISCPANVNVSCPGVVNALAPTATGDNCGIDSVSYVLTGATTGSGLTDASGNTFNVGVTTVTYTVTDLSGNTASCNFTVTVNDLVNPTISCPANVNVSCPGVVNALAPTATGDNCGIDSVSYVLTGATTGSGLTDASGSTFNVGVTTVTYTVTDLSGNTSSCNFTVTVNDVINPTISCPANVNVSCPGVVNALAPTATGDNCGIDSVSYVLTGATTGSGLTDASGSSFNVGVTTVTYTVTDLSGNTSSCNFTVTVNDVINPTISCPANVIASCPGTVTGGSGSIALLNFGDNCGVDSVNYVLTGATLGSGLNDASGTYFNAGITTVTYTVTDLSGNTESCIFTVTVVDNINPTISCPADVNVSCPGVVNSIAPLAFGDNCGVDSVSYTLTGATLGSGLSDASGVNFNQGVSTVTYTVTDSTGNTASCNFTVTVDDIINPTIICPGNIVTCDSNVTVPIPVFGDNCTGVTIVNDFNFSGDATGVYPLGLTTVNWTATDANGNTTGCAMTIEVETPPLSYAGPDQTIIGLNSSNLNAGSPSVGTGSWFLISGYGNVSNLFDPNSYLADLEPGENVFEWTVTNGTCPNSSDEVIITVIPLNIPNGFSPNNDGDNDYFEIEGIDLIENELIIFNRWGVELYSVKNYQNDWDGRSKDGKVLPEDTYFYIIKIPGLEEELSGFVVLKR